MAIEIWKGTNDGKWYWSITGEQDNGRHPRLYCNSPIPHVTKEAAREHVKEMLKAAQEGE